MGEGDEKKTWRNMKQRRSLGPVIYREDHCMRGEEKEEELRWGKSNIEWREEEKEEELRWGKSNIEWREEEKEEELRWRKSNIE